MFAGSCIGVVLLVMSLEFLRRAVKEYDAYLIRTHAAGEVVSAPTSLSGCLDDSSNKGSGNLVAQVPESGGGSRGFRPTILQQAVRALLHMVQFAAAYFVML